MAALLGCRFALFFVDPDALARVLPLSCVCKKPGEGARIHVFTSLISDVPEPVNPLFGPIPSGIRPFRRRCELRDGMG